MANINRVVVSGNLTRDVELRHVGDNQTPLASFAVAVNGWREGDVSFIDCKVWGRGAEVFAQYAGKGRKAMLSGRLEQERWEDNEGNNRSKIVLVVEDFDLVSDGVSDGAKANNAAGKPRTGSRAQADANYGEPVSSDDIPF